MAWKHGRSYWTHVRLADGTRKRCSLETNDKFVAREIERMLIMLRGRREWVLINAAVFGPSSIGELYDYWASDALEQLRRKLDDVDLQTHVDGWQQWLRRRLGPDSSSPVDYLFQLRALIPEGMPAPRSELTRKAVSNALVGLSHSGSTTRRYAAAWSSFFRYLLEIEVVEVNPVRDVAKPRENAPRERWLPLQESLRLVEAHVTPELRALAALREGSGIEFSAAMRTRRRDIDSATRMVHAHGRKTRNRDRRVNVDAPFWSYINEHIKALLPDANLWPDLTYDMVKNAHRRACAAIQLEDYRIHDARHSYAVRHMKAGDDPVLIAHNLGHANAGMVLRVYGKYRPTAEDYQRMNQQDAL